MVPGKPFKDIHGRHALPGATTLGEFVIHDQAAALLGHDVALASELRTLTPALAVQACFRAGLRGLGVVAALLPINVSRSVAPSTEAIAILKPKPLYRRPGLDQGAVDDEVRPQNAEISGSDTSTNAAIEIATTGALPPRCWAVAKWLYQQPV
jgi:hypothetical protein